MLIDKLLSLVFGILFLVALSCDGPGSRTGERGDVAARTLSDDPAFWDYAFSSNLLQTEIGQLVNEKEVSMEVKALASEAASYHGKALRELKPLAKRHTSTPLPDSLSRADRDLVNEFKQLDGEELESRYRAFIRSTHQNQLTRYQEALQRAEDQRIRKFLNGMLEHLRQELTALAKLDSLQGEPVD